MFPQNVRAVLMERGRGIGRGEETKLSVGSAALHHSPSSERETRDFVGRESRLKNCFQKFKDDKLGLDEFAGRELFTDSSCPFKTSKTFRVHSRVSLNCLN